MHLSTATYNVPAELKDYGDLTGREPSRTT